MSTMLLVPLEDIVVFPNMNVTLTVDVGSEERVLLVPRHENDYASVGTVAEVTDRVRLPGGGRAVALSGLHRGVAGAARTDAQRQPARRGRRAAGQRRGRRADARARARVPRDRRGDPRAARRRRPDLGLRPLDHASPARSPTPSATRPTSRFEQKVKLLETLDVGERLELAIELQRERLAEMQVRRRIRDDVEEGAAKQQREYILRKQMDSIRKELGEDDASVVEEYRRKIEEAELPEEVREQAERELGRLERQGDSSPEASMIRNYLDWLLAVPWGKRSEERLDPLHTREVLDADHAGLEDVKDRIVEYLAVRKLREERGIEPDKRSGAILTLVGPPGTGKTSIGESIARALGREFVRMSLGGVRDEAEIRGHRRTYIGALPGRLVRALRDAGTMNPVILLDEVDKVGADWRGDPSGGAARGARPGAEPLVPRPLPRRRARPLRGRLHRDREHRRHDPRPAARPDGGDPLRRLHGRREGRDRARLPLAAPARAERPARGRGRRSPTSSSRRSSPSTRARRACASSSASSASCCARPRRGSRPAKVEAPVEIGLDEVRDALGRQRFYQEAAERTAVPGVATGLAVTGTGGDVLFVEATAAEGRQARPHRPARRRDEGVGADRALLASLARRRARDRRGRVRADRSTCTFPRARSRRTGRARASRWRPRSRRCSRAGRCGTRSA